MMLQIMVYAIVMAAALSAAGLCLERLATLWGLPRRAAWVVALLFSVCWPPLMILSARSHTAATSVSAYSASPPHIDAGMPVFPDRPSASTAIAGTLRPVPQPVVRWNVSKLASDRNLLAAWAAISLVSALYLIAAQLRLRRRMAAWRQAVLLDQQVLLSETTGPALTGVFRPRLVIPRWLLDEPPTTQLLVLEHERQHIAAYDPLLIRAATLLLVAFPWNLPLWWQFRQMRRAIELDCDARVLRTGVAAQAYGEVLLNVVERATRMPMGIIAMSEPVSALERRIQNLLPDPVKHALLQASGLMAVLILSVGTAFAINAPAIPERPAVQSTSALPATIAPTPAPEPLMSIEASPPNPPPQHRIPAMAAAAPVTATTERVQPDSAPRFTVRILPRAPGTAAAGEEWNRIQVAMAARLRRVPGLALLASDADGEGAAEYELAIKIPEGNTFNIEARWLKAPPAAPSPLGIPTDGTAFFVGASRAAPELARSIDYTVTSMQLGFFPRDPAVEEQLLAQVADPSSSPEDRATVLDLLLANSEQRLDLGSMSISNGSPPASDALIRTAVDFAATRSDARQRAGAWARLRQINAPGLLAPVIAALGKETDAEVRLVLIGLLASNFSTEPPARSALESVVRTDQRQLARMAAQRALSGNDAGWNEYVLATLKNTQLTDSQRLEPLTYPNPPGQYQQQDPLDQEGLRILGTLLERAETFSNETASAVNALVRSPAAGGVLAGLLRVREGRQVLFDVRSRLISPHAARLPMDASRRALIEDIAARDPDTRIREAARAVLDSVARRERDIASLRQRLQ